MTYEATGQNFRIFPYQVWALRGGSEASGRPSEDSLGHQTGPRRPNTGGRSPQKGYGMPKTGPRKPQTGLQRPQIGPGWPQTGLGRPQTGPGKPKMDHEKPGGEGKRRNRIWDTEYGKICPVWFHGSIGSLAPPGPLPKRSQKQKQKNNLE